MQVRCLALLLACVLVGCGGAADPSPGTLDHGTYPLPDNPRGGPPIPPPDDGGDPPPPPPDLTGGVLVTIDTGGETWQWWVTNSTTAVYLERAWNGTYTGRFGGTLRAGPGAGSHNAPWSWHVDPDTNGHDIVFFAPPAPGPATPSQCESRLTEWLAQDTLFIANPFTIVAFDDRRTPLTSELPTPR